jgi:hypothetical protein
MSFSYIIAYRHSDDRIKNIESILEWVGSFQCEVIIVESDTTSKLSDLKSKFVFYHILLENNYPFNKSWCFNVGFKSAKNEKIVFGDADLIMNKDSLLSSIELLNEYECVNPYSSVVDLEKRETIEYFTSKDINKLFNIVRPGRGENDHQKVPMCGGIILFQKQALEKVSGWNEDFWGWGAEDDFMSNKVLMFLTYKNIKEKCYHLYHEKAEINSNLYYRNLHIYNYFKQATKEQLIPYFESIKDKIGLLEKKLN